MKNTNTSSSLESQEISEPFDSQKPSSPDYHYIKVPTNKGLQISKNRIQWSIHNTESMTQAARLLGVSYNTFKKYAKQYDIFKVAPHSGPNKGPLHFNWNERANAILEGKHPNYPIQKLQWLMLKEGKLVDVCYECNHQKKRVRDNKSPLLIDFLDKDHHNHQIDNMRMLCYNCYFLLDRPMIPMSKKYQEQKRMADSLHHFKEKFDEILEEKTDEIDEKIQAIEEIDDLDKAKPKVQDFQWGDIAMPDKF
jgi:hypothetical protein